MGEHTQAEVLNVGEIEYKLVPNRYLVTEKVFDENFGYRAICERAKAAFERTSTETPLTTEHLHLLKGQLASEVCQSVIDEFEQDQQGIRHESVAQVLIEQVFNEDLDEQIRSYFNSEYCIFWWSIEKVASTDEQSSVSARWHCDAGPTKHLKVIVYLNGHDEHKSDTPFLDKQATDKLKEIGYIFNNYNDRNTNITPLCEHFNVNYNPQSLKPSVGDAVIFNPNQVAHRALPPIPEKTRYALHFCVLPSALHWRDVIENRYFPVYGCQDFMEFAAICKKMTTQALLEEDCIEIATDYQVSNEQHLEYLLANIFSNISLAKALFNHIKSSDFGVAENNNLFALLRFIKNTIISQFDSKQIIQSDWVKALSEIAEYEKSFLDASNCYRIDNKPNPAAVFWPNPEHQASPLSKFDMLPYVEKQPIMDINTPIGSAGSCFAFEIAKHLQQAGYNYVITERNDDALSGLVVDGYQPGDQYAKFCANYGLLFNTPSFLQLAEKAFGVRHFNKLLIQHESGYYLDPYRDNVAFETKAAYLADYDSHLEAVRSALLECKVFIITLGLNECWQLQDGTFLSRTPRENMHHLVNHRSLTVQENVDFIQGFFNIIKQHNREFKLVVSVSPIPLLATGRADEHHVISANCYSKSVLRVAAEQLVANNQDIYYLPSYELVTECCHDAWEPDSRHVKPKTVARVIEMFKEMYVL
ncbi:GSCFA domain-containing protein [Thalassotalea euphylliae]|uniref:GSCFA domain-containing protein n=1 Tax=Thalassotalea euphylliae TaxID=1655234 RepID=A0A3E0UD96_9GAMM|nr:GSCFA domain-containing protein [Thalassotalea euphylliae]REL34800.1 hypothetical protein DXX92_05195 [Thalassotalea euphylliae]